MKAVILPVVCKRCQGLMYDSSPKHGNEEASCMTCGHVSYGEGFTPEQKVVVSGERYPRHEGSKL